MVKHRREGKGTCTERSRRQVEFAAVLCSPQSTQKDVGPELISSGSVEMARGEESLRGEHNRLSPSIPSLPRVRISISQETPGSGKVHQKELFAFLFPFSGVGLRACDTEVELPQTQELEDSRGPPSRNFCLSQKSRNDDGLTRSATYSATGEPRSKTVGDEFGNQRKRMAPYA